MNSSPRWTGLGLLTLGAVTGLAAWWGTSASDAPSTPDVPADSAHARPRTDSTGAVEAKRDELDPAFVTPGLPRELASLPLATAMASGDSAVLLTAENSSRVLRAPEVVEADIRRLAAAEGRSRRELADCIQELAANGSAAALDVLIRLLQEEEPDFAGKAEMLGRVLVHAEDERILPAARACYERLARQQTKDRAGLHAALRLVIHHGGSEGTDYALAVVEAEDPHLRAVASSLVEEMDRDCAPAIAAKIRAAGLASQQLLFGMMRWRSPESRQELLLLAYDGDLDAQARESIARGLAQTSPTEFLPELTRMYWNAANPACKELALKAVQSLAKNEDLSSERRHELALPLLSAALVEDALSLRQLAVLSLEHGDYPGDEVEPMLRQALAAETDPDQIQRLADLMQSLRG